RCRCRSIPTYCRPAYSSTRGLLRRGGREQPKRYARVTVTRSGGPAPSSNQLPGSQPARLGGCNGRVARVGEVARACRRAEIVDVRARRGPHGVSRLGDLATGAVDATFVRAHGIGRLPARPLPIPRHPTVEEVDVSRRRVCIIAETFLRTGEWRQRPGDRR